MGEPKGRRRYDRDFKEGAVRLILDGGRSVRSVARDLGIHENMLHRWKAEYLEDREHAFPGKGHMKPHEEELMRLRKKLADVEEEREILKKALAIFSKHRK
jgi:Transposase and inactivated derivatives